MQFDSSAITQENYRIFVNFLKIKLGHDLGEGKEYLIENRLNPVCEAQKIANVNELAREIKINPYSALGNLVVENMTIQETSFFRGPRVFDNLRKNIIPKLINENVYSHSIKIWSACCSTGQEPYSIMMLLMQDFPELENWNISLLATDVSENALTKARSGIYSRFEVIRGLSTDLKEKYFLETPDNQYQIRYDLRQKIKFQQVNLLEGFYALGGPFDIILLRNALIYFAPEVITGIFQKLRGAIKDTGFLILGESESIMGKTTMFNLPIEGTDYFTPAPLP
jgi:chemotaxis protein methyltransferase CheR